jgi:cytochrome b561
MSQYRNPEMTYGIIAQAFHWLVAALVLTQLGLGVLAPLAGWLYSSAAGLSINWFGLIQVPDLIAQDPGLAEVFKQLHRALVALLALLIARHVEAALRHAFWLRDGVAHRMLPWKPWETK